MKDEKNIRKIVKKPLPDSISNGCAPCKKRIDADAIGKRLRRVEGQVRAIGRMIEEERPCEVILSLINAAKSALHKTGQAILEGHLRHCVARGLENGDREKIIKKLISSIEQFLNIS
ncbi:MAG: metal-sensing transcriptional repressor [Rickettsiales bacterium]|nr:metal-sensing transcriptional repressor [Rickettsiales bacterium]